MNQEINILYLNNSEVIIKFLIESNKNFNKRLQLIWLMEKDDIAWKEAHKLSKIWYNIKFNNAKYNLELYKKYLYYNKLLEDII